MSHLMFTDDLILFGSAIDHQSSVVMDILSKFCISYEQHINMDTSNITFFKNTLIATRRSILAKIGFRETSYLGTYLGVPLSGKSPKIKDFRHLIEKVQTKPAHWKRSQLSFASQVTLAKSMIETIPTYTMMYVPIPQDCFNKIQQSQRSFIWGDSNKKRHLHTIC